MSAKHRLIVALDVDDKSRVCDLVSSLKEWVGFFKIGMRLFFRYGPDIVDLVQESGGRVFLDAKLHDIPSVVEAACGAIGEMGVDMLTVHSLGGVQMMRRAGQALKDKNPSARILGVTVLTSIDEGTLREQLGINKSPQEQVLFLAHQAKKAGLDGVVCSGKEAKVLRENLGEDFTLVVPGIRMSKIEGDEQKRVLTPDEAIRRGADYLVVGRPILHAPDPVAAAKKVRSEM